jgi:hypothetical protein
MGEELELETVGCWNVWGSVKPGENRGHSPSSLVPLLNLGNISDRIYRSNRSIRSCRHLVEHHARID